MKDIDNMTKQPTLPTKFLLGALVAITIPVLAPQVLAAKPDVSDTSLVAMHGRLTSMQPKLAPEPKPLTGHAEVRQKRTVKAVCVKRWHGTTKLDAKADKDQDHLQELKAAADERRKVAALASRSAAGIGALATDSLRVYQLMRRFPSGAAAQWKDDKLDTGPGFDIEIRDPDDDCTCESQRAHRLYGEKNYSEALDAYKVLSEKSLKVYGHKGAQYASALMWQGQCQHKMHHDKEAKALWREALDLYKKTKPKAPAVYWLKAHLNEAY
jgi:hypothetical protein